jgi:glycosyltransferase involved in cell wall biosynthesis
LKPRPVRVHQLLAALAYGDAIGDEALAIRGHLRAAGFESDIFAEKVHPRMADRARPLWQYAQVSSPATVCLYHFSIGSAAGRMIFHAPDRLVPIYHNITPARFFLGFHPHLVGLCHHGRRELATFAPRAELALGDSEYNRQELEASGFRRTGVLPIVLDLARYRERPSPVMGSLLGGGRSNLLFVGRVIPNKRFEDLLAVFAFYRRRDPRSRLLLVGDYHGHERYYARLRERAQALGFALGDDVVFTGHVEHDDLLACYAASDVFLCLSEHEGFCVPLLEAMAFRLPVVAYDTGAVRETLRGAGVLLEDKDPAAVAELVWRLRQDPALRASVLAGQERALGALQATDFGALLLERLAPVLEAA